MNSLLAGAFALVCLTSLAETAQAGSSDARDTRYDYQRDQTHVAAPRERTLAGTRAHPAEIRVESRRHGLRASQRREPEDYYAARNRAMRLAASAMILH